MEIKNSKSREVNLDVEALSLGKAAENDIKNYLGRKNVNIKIDSKTLETSIKLVNVVMKKYSTNKRLYSKDILS